MAIYSAVPPPPELTTAQQAQDAWTMSALQTLSVSPVARGTGTALAIPIDRKEDRSTTPVARPPSRRDSQRKREAILKGQEGSRQRRRWDNDRLVGVPNVQPPLPCDWEVHPTHPVHHIPYQLAQFWDCGMRQRAQDKAASLEAARKKQQRSAGSATGLGVGEVPRDLRESAKRSDTIRLWVRALEEPVRRFLARGQGDEDGDGGEEEEDSAADLMDSEDDEIVFVGRSGAMRELRERRERRETSGFKMARREMHHKTVDSGLVFDSFGDGDAAAFKRWLVHSISDYYGLASRSVTLAGSSCRVVYVGLKKEREGQEVVQSPRPLWEVC
ncbi:uv-damaged DNA-binding protein [Ophiocordyceps camponoti-floridani]|uniref:Uv-damaged DNA-binding protein n=1 Tax=Ophiocordyceps camponoti-floridani TaxID=2030778 RepID=A0A8H4QB68_9HYPO|nr:uv-damaged DNA-binding protein [Ophiocordyceps camponoti-floridani]